MKNCIFSLLVFLISLFIVSCSADNPPYDPLTYHLGFNHDVVFCTAVVDNRPVDNLTEIDLEAMHSNHIYALVEWYDIPPLVYDYHSKWLDTSNSVISEFQSEFRFEDKRWNTWSWFRVYSNVHTRGTWTFEVELDGIPAARGRLTVN